jgi:TolA-binding protein
MDAWTPEVIVSIIVQLSLAIGTLGSLIIGIGSAVGEARRSKTDIKRTDADIEMQEVEITSRLQQIAKGLAEDLRYELDIWKGKVMELDEQLQMQKEANRRLKYCLVEIMRIVNRMVKEADESSIGEIREELNELDAILTQMNNEFTL